MLEWKIDSGFELLVRHGESWKPATHIEAGRIVLQAIHDERKACEDIAERRGGMHAVSIAECIRHRPAP